MKTLLGLAAAGVALSGWAGAPSVSNISLTQSTENGPVEITYDLAGEDAVVTMELQENGGGAWKTLTGAALTDDFAGDVARKVAVGTGRKIRWTPPIGAALSSRNLRAVLTAYPTNNPPDYMSVELASGAVRFYSSSNTVPYGVLSRVYKLDTMLFRKIPAKNVVWRMGSPTTEKWRTEAEEYPHKVKLTYDYYMGVFELTRRQSYMLTGYWHQADDSNATVPADEAEMAMPASHWDLGRLQQENTLNPLVLLRSQTGIASFNVPYEAEWEYAARGGKGTSCYGGNITQWTADDSLNPIARYNIDTKAEGGSKRPNAFGLYDTIGNVHEWCREIYTKGSDYTATFAEGWESGAVTVDPQGPSTTVRYDGNVWYTYRGGCASRADAEVGHACRAAQRNERYLWRTTSPNLGVRIMCLSADAVK